MRARAVLALILASLGPAGCSSDDGPQPEEAVALRLSRAPDGSVALELQGAENPPRALQAELLIDSSEAFLIEEIGPAAGLALDSVRGEMRGTNRAILFVGDKRGLRLPTSGAVARFRVVPSSSGGSAPATVSIKSALLASSEGSAVPLTLGNALRLR